MKRTHTRAFLLLLGLAMLSAVSVPPGSLGEQRTTAAAASAVRALGPSGESVALPAAAEASGVPAAAALAPSRDKLKASIEGWRLSLSRKSGFEQWADAEWTIEPLGAGTHGWVVILSRGGSEVGYMIVQASRDGSLHLTEYGTGEHPLFSMKTLYQSLVRHGLIPASSAGASGSFEPARYQLSLERYYMHPLQTVWAVNRGADRYIIDAKTGELRTFADIPPARAPIEAFVTGGASASDVPGDPYMTAAFDPYESLGWLTAPPAQLRHPADAEDLLRAGGRLTLAGTAFDGRLTTALPMTGVQPWSSGHTFAAFDQDGPRFFAWRTALTAASLYR